jgi:hypothetical protein
MAIPFQCHQCGGQFAAPDQFAGKKAKCQRCGAVVQVPHAPAGPSEGELAAQAFSMAMAGQPVGGRPAPQTDLFGSAGMTPNNPVANPLTPMGANPYGQAANPYGQQAGGAYLQPAVGAGSGGGMPWGWILGGGAALIVLAGVIGVVVTISSLLSRPDPAPIVANLPNNGQPNNNQPAPNPVAPQPANNPFEEQPGENPFTAAASNPFEQTKSTPTASSPPATSSTPATSGENPFANAEQVSLPNRPMGLPKGGEDIENPFGDQAIVNEPAAGTPAATDANMTAATGWSLKPDPPALPIEYKKGKISIPFPDRAEIRLPHGPSHFVLGALNDFKADAFQVFDLRTGKAIGKQIMTPDDFGRQDEVFSPDGRYLAAAQRQQGDVETTPIVVWSFVSGDVHRTLELAGRHISPTLRFGAPHQLISLHNPDWESYILTVWDLQSGGKLKEVRLPRGRGDTQLRPESLSISPGGRYACLLIGKQLGTIDLTTGEPAGAITLSEPPSSCEGTMFSPDGAELAVVVSQGSGHHLYIFDIATGRVLLDKDYRGRLQTFFYKGPQIDWLPDKSGLVFAGHLLLERNTGEEVWVFPTTDSNPRRLISAGDILVLLRERSAKVLKTEELPEKDIAKAMQSVKDGGAAVDSALPPLTTADLFSATSATLPNGFVQWSLRPDVGGTPPRGQEREILIAKEGETVQRMIFAAPESGKVVVQKEVTAKGGPGRAQSRQIVIERYDTLSGSKGNTLPLPNVYQLGDVSPSGDFAVVAFAKESGKFDRLDVVGLSPKKHICAWRPFGGEQDKKPDDPLKRHFWHWGWSNDPKLVVWAAMIDDQHVLTINTAGKLICWKVPECKAVYYFEDFGEPLALSAGRRYLAAAHFGEFRIFDALTGQCVGDLEAPALGTRTARGGFRPDGGELAAVIDAGPDKMLVRWNLVDGKIIQEIPIPGQIVGWHAPFHFAHNGARAGLEYRGDKFVLLDDQYLINLGTRAVTWRYHLSNGYFAANAPDENTWYGIRKNNASDNSIFLTYMPTPSQAVKNKTDVVSLEQQLVLYPGLSVRLHVDLNAVGMGELTPSVTKAVQQSLEARGFIIDPGAPLTFSMVAGQRSTGESVGVYEERSPFGFRSPFGPSGNPTETVDIQEMVCRMAVSNASGKVLWHQDRGNRMRSWGSVTKDGSASQQLRDEMVNGFKNLLASSGSATEAVPRYIFADLDTILAGESTLGFRTEGPPPNINLQGQAKRDPGIAPGS